MSKLRILMRDGNEYYQVDEHGTEAAAATALIALAGAMIEEKPPRPIPFVVDRLFYFFIQERRTGAVLFMGRVLDPRGWSTSSAIRLVHQALHLLDPVWTPAGHMTLDP